jgi:phosphoribosylformylglycinamidine cyclo-ligase
VEIPVSNRGDQTISGDKEESFYERRGASATKVDVHRALEGLSAGLFPGAFCKAVPDVLGDSAEHCVLSHADGAGTKAALAYIQYLRHQRPEVFVGIAQDSLVMNLDDLLCVGATGPFIYSNTIGRNSKQIPGEVIRAIIHGYEEFADRLRPYGVELVSCGGETADVGDLVRTIIVDSSIVTRMRRADFIDCSRVQAGHVIVGLASFGRASYESTENSGIGTNGFTALRHGVLTSEYREQFPQTYAPEIAGLAYTGRYDLDSPLPGTPMTIGDASLSPTRTYAPIVLKVVREMRPFISAIFHNTGGGQTKCMGFGRDVRYVKDNLFEPPPIFRFIRSETGIRLREMLRTFNMGHRLEIVCDRGVADRVLQISADHEVAARIIGRVESMPGRSLVVEVSGETEQFGES